MERKMSRDLIHRAISDHECFRTPRLKSLMHTLARYGDHDGKQIYPGKQLLARKEKCTEQWIKMLLRDLEQEGYIQALDKKGGRGHKTHYEICLEKLGLVTVTPATQEVTPDIPTPPPEIPSSNVTHFTGNGALPTEELNHWREKLRTQQLALESARGRRDALYMQHAEERIRKAQAKIAELEGELQNVSG